MQFTGSHSKDEPKIQGPIITQTSDILRASNSQINYIPPHFLITVRLWWTQLDLDRSLLLISRKPVFESGRSSQAVYNSKLASFVRMPKNTCPFGSGIEAIFNIYGIIGHESRKKLIDDFINSCSMHD